VLTVTAGHDVRYYLRSARTGGVGYYNRGDEPPGMWAGAAAERLGLTGNVDPKAMIALFHKLITSDGEKLYSGRAPRYVTGQGDAGTEAVEAAIAAAGPFVTPAETPDRRAGHLGRVRLGAVL
jgi:hypothetical protein